MKSDSLPVVVMTPSTTRRGEVRTFEPTPEIESEDCELVAERVSVREVVVERVYRTARKVA